MSYLNKQQYEFRSNSAASRNEKNENIAVKNGMSEEQADVITRLCSLRHKMHSNIDSLVVDQTNSCIVNDLCSIGVELVELGFDKVCGLPAYSDDYIDIDDFRLLYELGDEPDDEEEKVVWYADEFQRIYKCWSFLNKNIENYLSDIDKKFGTNFKPSGSLRIF